MASELRAFAVSMNGDSYDAVVHSKRPANGSTESWVDVMRGVYSAVLWLLTITVVLFIFGSIFTGRSAAPSTPGSISITAAATSVASAGKSAVLFGSGTGTAPASTAAIARGTAAGSIAASAAPVGEIQEVETSRYNHDYFCTVKRSTQTGPSQASITFAVVGDWSLGGMQDPLASTISWDGGFVKAAHHQYDVDDVKHEFIEGTLTFDGVPQGKTLRFRFGEGGYSEVTLPLVLQQLPQPAQPQPQLVQLEQSVQLPGLRGIGAGTAPGSTAATATGTTAASAAPVGEIQDVETSRYNHDYFCTVKRSTQTGPSQASIAFAVVGDWSMGRLQDPLASTLSWDGGFVKAAHHQYEVDDVKHEFIEGTLTFDGVPQGKSLRFRFGEGGYSEATLPLMLQQLPQPAQPQPQLVQLEQSEQLPVLRGSGIGTAPASTAPTASGTATGSTAASAAPVGEIQDIETSRYNHDYFCTVKRSTQTGPSQASITFAVVGDWSLGRLQDPLASTLSWDGGFVKAAHHQYEVDDVKHEFIEGTLTFDAVPQGKSLGFRFGEGGYSTVTLPLMLQQLPQPAQPQPQLVQLEQSVRPVQPQPQPYFSLIGSVVETMNPIHS